MANRGTQASPDLAPPAGPLTAYQMRILAVLVLINFINFADRLVVPPLLGQLRDTFQLTSVRLAAALQAVLPASPHGLNRQTVALPI